MRKQFSMFQNEKFASYVFGGTHSEASFAHDLLDRESGVILVDEFDKADALFHSAFYQLFDDGVFEDKNYRVEVGPALIICTSNYGSEEEIRNSVGDALYSRFDGLIRYTELAKDEIVDVIDRIVDARFDGLTSDGQARVDREEMKSNLRSLAGKTGNVRKLGEPD
jgi:ATP-dependent Clp protease ATP-binding subunit ClpA